MTDYRCASVNWMPQEFLNVGEPLGVKSQSISTACIAPLLSKKS